MNVIYMYKSILVKYAGLPHSSALLQYFIYMYLYSVYGVYAIYVCSNDIHEHGPDIGSETHCV